jgi:hypothetical protein
MKIVSGCTKFRFNSHINHASYAAAHGYGYRFDVTPRKVSSVFDHKIHSILDCPIDGDWWFWIDDDAFFTQLHRPFESLDLTLDDTKLMIFPKSPTNTSGGWTYLSSGNFFFRSVPAVHEFFKSVIQIDIAIVKRWWSNKRYGIFTRGDQDRIVYCLENNNDISMKTVLIPWDIFNFRPHHFETSASEHFLVHFAVSKISKLDALRAFQQRFGFTDDTLVPHKFCQESFTRHYLKV